MDPRKPIHRPSDETQDAVRSIAHKHLLEVTSLGAKALGCSGASFVMIGMGIWASELSELDSRATAKLLASLATLYDPASNNAQKIRAEKKRRNAVKLLLGAVDIEMSTPAGTA